jgi:sugar (pentulose or hexulose) kinase
MDDPLRAPLLNHFIANALQMPVVLVPAQCALTGNVMVQAMALGHVRSLEEARQNIHDSLHWDLIQPHAQLWNAAFERLTKLV